MIKKVLNIYKNHLTFKEKSKVLPLTKLSILIIMILNLFVYISITMGISFQTKVVNNPNTKYDYECREMIRFPEKALKYDQYYYFYDKNHYRINSSKQIYKDIYEKELDQKCLNIYDKLNNIKNDKELINTKNYIENIKKDLNKIEVDLSYIRNNYNTVLFEKIANQNSNDSILKFDLETNNVKDKYNKLIKSKDLLNSKIEKLSKEFEENNKIKDFHKTLNENKILIENEYQNSMRYYNIKISLISILFVLPLIIYFYYRMNKNNRENNYSKYMINKNLLIVSSIPLFLNIIEMIYNLIPHTLIKKLVKFFYEIQIPFIAYYIVIGIFVLILTFIVIKIQNKKEKERLLQKETKIDNIFAYNQSICSNCKNRVNYIYMNNCPICGNQLKIDCEKCNEKKIKILNHCHSCGE